MPHALRLPQFEACFELELGEDTGRALGTLAEYEGDGVRLSLGFPNSAQTRGLLSFRHIECACRRPDDMPEFEDLGRPSETFWRPDLRNVRETLIDTASHRAFDGQRWANYTPVNPVPAASLCNVIPVGAFDLIFPHGVEQVFYGARPVLSYCGSIRTSAYYDGRIAVAHVDSASGRAWITVADWQPSWETARNIRCYHWIAASDVYAIIGWRGAFWMTDGADASPDRTMRLYRITRAGIEVAADFAHVFRSGNEGYGMAVAGERLLIGHFPSGLVLAFDGERLEALTFGEDIMQKLGTGLNAYAYGESQTLTIYGGKIWVGHYPWGYLLSGDAAAETWQAFSLFGGQDARSNSCPYRDEVALLLEAAAQDCDPPTPDGELYDEMWARRIHSAAWYDNGLALGLASRRGTVYDAGRDKGIDPADLTDYGSVRVVRMPNTLAAPFPWPKSGEARICLSITETDLALSVNGQPLARRAHTLTGAQLASLRLASVGSGVYGASEVPVRLLEGSRLLSGAVP